MNKVTRFIAILTLCLFIALSARWITLYSPWDDEANTALFAQSVKRTGDTDAKLGNNIIAYRNGAELNEELRARYVSPLQYYFLAPFIDKANPNPVQARIPFLLMSCITLALVLHRALKQGLSLPIFLFLSSLIIAPTVFLLFSNQIRYYSLCFLWSALLIDRYAFQKKFSTRDYFWAGVFSSLLFVSNYLIGVATLVAIAAHAFFFKRDLFLISIKKAAAFCTPHALISLPVFWIWNPLGKNVVAIENTAIDRLNLLYRNIRDFNGGHFGSIFILMIGLVFLRGETRNRFQQYAVAFIAYLITIALLSPQPVRGTGVADIRYLLPLVFLGWMWMIDFAKEIYPKSKKLFFLFAFSFSFLSLPYSGQLHIPLLKLIKEFQNPATDPYRSVSQWLNHHAKPNDQIASSLDYALYPLMYLSPQFHYVGQLEGDIQKAPDYVISFCDDSIASRFSHSYELVTVLDVDCRERFRPEIFHRSFGTRAPHENVKIYKINHDR